MVVKGNHQKGKPVATSEQIRMAQLTLEGKSTDDGSGDIQKLIKRVIEMTSCTHARAELALYDNDNDLGAAVDYILENAAQIDCWTEQKSKKEKKKDDEKVSSSRGQSAFRGRGGSYADRGGRGRGAGGQTRGAARNVVTTTAGAVPSGRGRRGAHASADASRPVAEISKANEPESEDVNNDWKNGPLEFKQSAAAVEHNDVHETAVPSSSSAPMPEPSQPVSGPISFAAVAAAAVRKEQMKKEPAPSTIPVQNIPAPSEDVAVEPIEVPATSDKPEAGFEEAFDESVHTALDVEEDNESVKEETSVSVDSPQQANTSWTNQLKNELGIGLDVQTQAYSSVQLQSLAPEPAGVEFATETVTTGLVDYHFGFVDIPTAPIEAPAHEVPSPPVTALEPLFNPTRHASNPIPQSKTEVERGIPSNGDFSKVSPPVQSFSHGNRSLGYGDASSISYNPSSTERLQKGGHHQPQAQQQPQQHQQMFNPQMPYSFPYMNMYSPVTGVRTDDPYSSAALMQYPFGVNMDLTTMMPGSNPLAQSANTQQMSASHHRTDSHNMDGLKYQPQTNREQSQQPSNVAPPPGFANPTPFMPHQPALSSMFMQQPYAHHPYSFMMPNVGNAGRQMYAQEDDRKTYDKMGGAKQAQATPPPHYQSHGGGYLSGMNKKQQYTWNN